MGRNGIDKGAVTLKRLAISLLVAVVALLVAAFTANAQSPFSDYRQAADAQYGGNPPAEPPGQPSDRPPDGPPDEPPGRPDDRPGGGAGGSRGDRAQGGQGQGQGQGSGGGGSVDSESAASIWFS